MNFFSWQAILAMILGSLYGLLFGALPGLTATLALSLFIPIALFLDPGVAFSAIIGITATAIFAGDIGAVAVRIPGTPASAAYTEEIYDIGQEHSPAYALGIASIPSAIGSLIGVVILIAGSLVLAQLAKQFSSFEYFWLVLLGLISGIFASENLWKGTISFCLGMLLATMGVDPAMGQPRFDFGSNDLRGGLDFIVALIAFFGISEVLENVYNGRVNENKPELKLGKGNSIAHDYFVKTWELCMNNKWRLLRSSLVGTFIGFLPGAGSDLAAWVSSNFARMGGGNKEQITLEGTTSNNAAVAGTWIPALALGIPGDTLTAIILGMFLTLGITPGPELFAKHMDFVVQIFTAFILVSVLIMPVTGYFSAMVVNQMLRVPMRLLLGVLPGLCLVGAYAINNNPFDLIVMVFIGALGLVLRKGGFPLGQLILGMVLGPLLEQYMTVSLVKTNYDLTAFFSRPVAVVLALCNIALIAAMIWLRTRPPAKTAA